MAIDLSSLDGGLDLDAGPATKEVVKEVIKSDGKPLELPLADVEPDPNQPRKEFNDDKILELAESIAVSGIRSPVSVRQHPTKPGKWMLNFGERRWRAAGLVGLATIPAFIDSTSDTYAQVIENLQREDLTAMEMANFIASRLAEKEKKGDIAAKLGVKGDAITFHMSLIDAPDSIMQAYRAGKFSSARVAYELRKAHEKHGDALEVWIANQAEITRADVQAISKTLSSANTPAIETKSSEADGEQGAGQASAAGAVESPNIDDGSGKSTDTDTDSGPGADDEGIDELGVDRLVTHNPNNEESGSKEPKQSDPSKIKKPILLVVFDKRAAMVMLNKRPSSPGLIHIKYEDNGEEVEVDAGKCKINLLMESQQG